MILTAPNCKNSLEKREMIVKYREMVSDFRKKLKRAAISLSEYAREELFGGDTVDDITATSEDHRGR